VQLEHFERPLNDDPIPHVLVTHGLVIVFTGMPSRSIAAAADQQVISTVLMERSQ
jgi:hypothetical protein